MADIQAVAAEFVKYYYDNFDNQRNNLAALYRPSSMLSFEASQFQGAANICEKLTSLPFEKVAHQITTCDAQPGLLEGSLIILVTGALLTDNETRPTNFSQTFQLVPENGSFYIQNDMFRLNYGCV